MPDVFLSYAHEDDAFVERLRAALTARNREVWLDRSTEVGEGVVPASDWNASALDGIDRSDGFVFVLSPSSLASRPCRDELSHAVAGNKRLLPVCVSEPPDPPVAGQEVPEPLQPLSWIMLRPRTDDFDAGVDALIRALDTDIDVVREHTRILVRAKAWELAQRRTSPLLRGEELRAAELWLPRAAAAGAPPTDVQRDFIIASRQAANRRQRITVAGSLTVAAVAIALSVFALIQRSHANHQAKLAQSRADAASAQASLGTDPEQSIALAAAGVRRAPTPQAVNALAVALQTSRLRAVLDLRSAVDAVAFSPDGRELAIGSFNGAVRLWRLSDRRVLWTRMGAADQSVESLSFAAQGDRLVVGRSSVNHGCSTEVLSTATGAVTQTLGTTSAGSCEQYVAVVGATRDVAVSTGTGLVGLWNVDTGRSVGPRVQEITGSLQVASGLVASPTGQRLAVLGIGRVEIVNIEPGPSLSPGGPAALIDSCWCGATAGDALAGVPPDPRGAAFSPDGTELLIAAESRTAIYDLSVGRAQALYAQGSDTVSGAWAGDGRILAAVAPYLGVDVWSSSSGLVALLHGGPGAKFTTVAMSADGTLAGGGAGGDGTGSVRIWDADPDLWDASISTPANASLSGDETAGRVGVTAVGDATTGIVLVSANGRRAGPPLYPHGGSDTPGEQSGPFAVGADGILAFTRGRRLVEWRLPSGRPLRSWALPSGAVRAAPTAIAISTDGTTAAIGYAGDQVTRFAPSGETTIALPGLVNLTQLSISADGRLLAVSNNSGIRILSARLTTIRRIAGDAVAFAPSANLLAVLTPSGSIEVLRTDGWFTQAVAQGDITPATGNPQLTFSPDDRLLATVGGDGVLRVWDATDGALLATRQVLEYGLPAQMAPPPPVALTATGDAIVGEKADDAIRTYDVCDQCFDPRALLTQADTRLAEIRPLTVR